MPPFDGRNPLKKERLKSTPFLPPQTTTITTNWLLQAATLHHASSYELRAATMQCECAKLSAHHEAMTHIAISLYSDIATIRATVRIDYRWPRRQCDTYRNAHLHLHTEWTTTANMLRRLH